MSRTMISPRFALVAPLVAAACLGGCSSETPDKPESPYAVVLERGCAVDLEHEVYDPKLPGFWLVGTDATVSMSLAKGKTRPDSYAFMIRTRATADAAKPSRLDTVSFLTARYRVLTGFNAKGARPVNVLAYTEKKEGTEIIPVESDASGKFIIFEQVGDRVKVTITRKGLDMLGDDVAFTWKETPENGRPAGLTDEQKAAAKARRIM